MQRDHFSAEHEAFRERVRAFIADHVLPEQERWRAARRIDHDHFALAARHGLLGLRVDPSDGGQGLDDYRFNQVVLEEYELAGVGPSATGIMLQNDVVGPYLTAFADADQRERWLRGLCRGELIGALAITEPDTGSDVAGVQCRAVAQDGGYRVSGGKKYIGCGVNADFVVTVVRTDPAQRHRGLTLLVLERDMDGYEVVQNIARPGRLVQDVAELAFDDVWVPRDHRLGEEGAAFGYLMRNLVVERMQIAVSAVAACRHMLSLTLDRVRSRVAFGRPIGANQHVRFELAELDTAVAVAESHVDRCVREMNAGRLTAVEAAQAKWWTSELQVRCAERCLQLHGANGWMDDSPMSRAWADARVTTIYGGTTEIMKEIVGRELGL